MQNQTNIVARVNGPLKRRVIMTLWLIYTRIRFRIRPVRFPLQKNNYMQKNAQLNAYSASEIGRVNETLCTKSSESPDAKNI